MKHLISYFERGKLRNAHIFYLNIYRATFFKKALKFPLNVKTRDQVQPMPIANM